jgi:hypothetical protein
MSKISYCLLGIIGAALIYMGAVRLQEWYAQRQAEQEIAAQNDGEPFTFQQVPISLAAPEVELMQSPIKYQRPYPEIYLEDIPLTQEQQIQQAQDTIESIVQDFKDEPALKEFNQELQQVSKGEVQGLADLSTQNLQQILQKNPEISHVVEKHAKEVDFAAVLDEIFSNPQFQQSVEQLQGKGRTPQKQAAQ